MAERSDLDRAVSTVCSKFKIPRLNLFQMKVISEFVKGKSDIFVNLPTGYGKSLVYQALPSIFDSLTDSLGHVVVVVSPLIHLMRDQVQSLRSIGISAASLSDLELGEAEKVEKAGFSVLFGSPESWLKNERWRKVLSSPIYAEKLCCVAVDEAHVIKQWGTSTNNKMAAFRSVYADLHELRTLAPSVKMMALTATAIEETKKTIIDVLRMTNVCEVAESPNKGNITYVVSYMPNDSEVQDYFNWIVEEIKQGSSEKTIIYCQTIKQCSLIYGTLKSMLGQCMYKTSSKCPVLEMLHSCTPDDNKEAVLKSFGKEDGPILLLVATIAFGMGVDCKGVHRTIHFGPSKNVEAFIQETGRAGRDGKASFSYLVYKGLMLNHVEKDIKEYIKTKDCRRKTLLKHFGIKDFTIPGPLHTCCDNCANRCNCNTEECCNYTLFVVDDNVPLDSRPLQQKRQVSDSQRKHVKSELIKYRKSLVIKLISKSAHGHVKSLTNLNTLLCFSEIQIEQVVSNSETIFCLEDVMKTVEIWDMCHAKTILNVLQHVFGDIAASVDNIANVTNGESNDELDDDELLGEWAALAEDEELLNMLTDSFSFSEMDSTYQDATHQSMDCSDVSPVALASLKNVNIN